MARLESWKEIAGHLERDVRTVQRWEKNEGLPVHRHMHSERGTVYAYTEELDQWSADRSRQVAIGAPTADVAPQRDWRPFVLAGSGAVLAATAALIWFAIPKRPITATAKMWAGRLLATTTTEGHKPIFVPLDFMPSSAVLARDGSEAYLVASGADLVAVMDTRTNRIVRRLKVAARPTRLALSPDGRRIYVGSGVADLSIIDTATKKVTVLPTGGPVSDLAFTPDGGKLFLASEYAGLKRLSIGTGELVTLPGTVCPMYLAMNPSGTRLYVSYQCGGPGGRPGHDAIDVVDTATERSVAVFSGPPLVGSPFTLMPDGSHVWTSGADACMTPRYDRAGCPVVPGQVFHVVRTSDLWLVQTLGYPWHEPGGAASITMFPDGSRAILSGREIRVVDTTRFATVEYLEPTPGYSPHTQAVIAADVSRVYVPHVNPNGIAIFDLNARKCEPARSGLTNFWPADGSADDAHDGIPAELRSGAAYAPGRVGRAFSLDGVDDFVSIRHPHSGSISVNDGSFAAWVKFGSAGRGVSIADKFAPTGGLGWKLFTDPAGRFVFCLGGGTGCVTSRATATAGRWYHVVGTRRGNEIALYVNGRHEASKALSAPIPPAGTDDYPVLNLGANQAPGAFLNGLIDEVVLYRRGLHDADVRQLFEAGGCVVPGDERSGGLF